MLNRKTFSFLYLLRSKPSRQDKKSRRPQTHKDTKSLRMSSVRPTNIPYTYACRYTRKTRHKTNCTQNLICHDNTFKKKKPCHITHHQYTTSIGCRNPLSIKNLHHKTIKSLSRFNSSQSF